uniref:Uncharacterized protein n=1 Tax=Anguilla anguilla TaxID=7936 RepID=A0A0E9SHN4_ANGAN
MQRLGRLFTPAVLLTVCFCRFIRFYFGFINYLYCNYC